MKRNNPILRNFTLTINRGIAFLFVSILLLASGAGIAQINTPAQSFDGISAAEQPAGYIPPRPCGAIGPNHYVQITDIYYKVFSRTGTALTTLKTIQDIFPTLSLSNFTPNFFQVLYDQVSDRWVFMESGYVSATVSGVTTNTQKLYVAVSQSPDPTGAFYSREINANLGLNEVMGKVVSCGLWTDGLYITYDVYEYTPFSLAYTGLGAIAIKKGDLISGVATPATAIKRLSLTQSTYKSTWFTSNINGTALPPAGAPNLLMRVVSNEHGAPADGVECWEFKPDFVTPSNSTLTNLGIVNLIEFDSRTPSLGTGNIEQAATTQLLTSNTELIGGINVSYINLNGSTSSWVLGFNINVSGVDPTSSANLYTSGIKWAELRRSGNNLPTVAQEGVYKENNNTSMNIWNAALAQNRNGDIMMAFHKSSSTTYPKLYVAGRRNGDPAGQMTQGEVELAGAGSQTHSSGRWGEYNVMSLDPLNFCDFWLTGEYYAQTSYFYWKTKIVGGLNFLNPSCIFNCSSSPSNLSVSNISATSATINFTAPTPAPSGGYDYFINTTNVPPTLITVPTGNASTNPINLIGLSFNTTYYVWVRSNCLNFGFSNWVASPSFTTNASCTAASMTQPSNLIACAGQPTAMVNFTGLPAGNVNYRWYNNNTAIGLAATGSGNIASFSPVNSGILPVTANITVTPYAGSGYAYIPNYNSESVSVIELSTNTSVATIPIQYNPASIAISHDGSRVYVANRGVLGILYCVLTANNTVYGASMVGDSTTGMVAHPDGTKLYIAKALQNRVAVISTTSLMEQSSISVGNNPHGLTISPHGEKLYVANALDNTVSVINTSTNTISATIPVGATPKFMVMNEDGSKLLVSNTTSNSVSIINTATNTVDGIVGSIASPMGIAISPDGTKAYVASSSTATVYIINLGTNVISGTITGFVQPTYL